MRKMVSAYSGSDWPAGVRTRGRHLGVGVPEPGGVVMEPLGDDGSPGEKMGR
jgi:hypothetical protein